MYSTILWLSQQLYYVCVPTTPTWLYQKGVLYMGKINRLKQSILLKLLLGYLSQQIVERNKIIAKLKYEDLYIPVMLVCTPINFNHVPFSSYNLFIFFISTKSL